MSKYIASTLNKKLIFDNDEYLNLAKILISEKMTNCPIRGVEELIKLQNYDEELDLTETRVVKVMQMGSEIPFNNVLYVAVGQKIYKYDLPSKRPLMEFSAYCDTQMTLYDHDNRMMTSSEKEVRLWQFQEKDDDMKDSNKLPSLVTVMETPAKIECLKVNKYPEKEGERAGVFYYVISEKDKFSVYIGRL